MELEEKSEITLHLSLVNEKRGRNGFVTKTTLLDARLVFHVVVVDE